MIVLGYKLHERLSMPGSSNHNSELLLLPPISGDDMPIGSDKLVYSNILRSGFIILSLDTALVSL